MPLIIITGFPSSGKSLWASRIQKYLLSERNKTVCVVSDNDAIATSGIPKNELYFDFQKEKQIRGILKSEVLRLLTQGDVVIFDASNYIKGYRYEMYCASKSAKTTQVTVECAISTEKAWEFNLKRPESERYTDEAFKALCMRHEPPDSRNRWDSPLVTIQHDDELPGETIYKGLFERQAPPPNMSTQCTPLASTNFLYELDKTTQDINSAVLSAKNLCLLGENVKLPGYEKYELSSLDSSVTPIKLAKLRRQFLSYTKLNPPSQPDLDKIAASYFEFLNANLKQT
nr:PREDICTED: protein KTI12 homolog [Bemisia tabaci]